MPVAEHTEHLSVGTAIAVAFARNPPLHLLCAYAHDEAAFTPAIEALRKAVRGTVT